MKTPIKESEPPRTSMDAAAEQRACRVCRQLFPLSYFAPGRVANFDYICRPCDSKKVLARYHARKAQPNLVLAPSESAPSSSHTSSSGSASSSSSVQQPEAECDCDCCSNDLYVMQNVRLPGELKIGRSQNVQERVKTLQTAQNFRIRVVAVYPGAGRLENTVHRILRKRRVEDGPGQEWFRSSRKRAFSAIAQAMESET